MLWNGADIAVSGYMIIFEIIIIISTKRKRTGIQNITDLRIKDTISIYSKNKTRWLIKPIIILPPKKCILVY